MGDRSAIIGLAIVVILGIGLQFLIPYLNQQYLDYQIIKYRLADGTPYLSGPDDYYFLRHASQWNREIEDKSWAYSLYVDDELRNYPHKARSRVGLYPLMLVWWNSLLPFRSMDQAAYYFPLIAYILSILFMYGIARKFASMWPSLVGAALFASVPAVLESFHLGMGDTDAIIMLLYISSMYLWLWVVSCKERAQQIAAGIALILMLIIFWQVWSNFYFVLALIVIVVVTAIIIASPTSTARFQLKLFYRILIVSGIVIIGAGTLWKFLPQRVLVMLHLAKPQAFVAAYTTVTELQSISLTEFWKMMDGPLLIFALGGAIVVIWRFWKQRSISYATMVVWILGFSAFPFLAARLANFAVIPIILSAILGIDVTADWMVRRTKQSVASIVPLAIGFMIIFFSVPSIADHALRIPLMDDGIYESAMTIRNLSESVVIACPWDEGYYYEYFANRPVLLDGGDFASHRQYWYSRALMSKDTNESLGILRMLVSGKDRGRAMGNPYLNASCPEDIVLVASDRDLRHVHIYRYFASFSGTPMDNITDEVMISRQMQCSPGPIYRCGMNSIDIPRMTVDWSGTVFRRLLVVNGSQKYHVHFPNPSENATMVVRQLEPFSGVFIIQDEFDDSLLFKALFLREAFSSGYLTEERIVVKVEK